LIVLLPCSSSPYTKAFTINFHFVSVAPCIVPNALSKIRNTPVSAPNLILILVASGTTDAPLLDATSPVNGETSTSSPTA